MSVGNVAISFFPGLQVRNVVRYVEKGMTPNLFFILVWIQQHTRITLCGYAKIVVRYL